MVILMTIKLEIIDGKDSWTGIKNYMECQYKYYLGNTTAVEIIPSDAMSEGNEFHEFANKYFDKFDKPPSWKEAKKWWGDFFNENSEQMCKGFVEFEQRRYEWCQTEKLPWKPIYREKEFETKYFTIVIDRLEVNGKDEDGNNTYTLIEYKRKPSPWDTKQLSFYHLILTAFDIKVTKWARYYAFMPEKNKFANPYEKSINALQRKLGMIWPSIKQGLFRATPGFHCKFCEFQLEGCDLIGLTLNRCSECGKDNISL